MKEKNNNELREVQHLFGLIGVGGPDKIFFGNVLFDEDFEFSELFNDNIRKLKPFESPDLVFSCDGLIYGIEVFEFDASRKLSKKGSKLRINEIEIDRRAGNQAHYEELLSTELTLNNYRNNLLGTFDEHYKMIPNYKENIKSEFKCGEREIKICFLIIDKTPGNLTVCRGNESIYYSPLMDEMFLTRLKKSRNLDYLITFHEEDYIRYPTYISVTSEHIEFLQQFCHKNLREEDVRAHKIREIIECF